MRKRLPFAAGMAAVALGCCSAALAEQAPPPPRTDPAIAGVIAVEKVDLGEPRLTDGRGTVPVTIQLRNISQKAIYALEFSVSGAYADGSVRTNGRFSVDLLGSYLFDTLHYETRPPYQLFRPGDLFTEKGNALPLGPGNSAPVSADVAVTTVVFEDRTALGDPERINRIFAGRSDDADDTAAVIDSLQLILKAPDPVKAALEREQAIIAGRIPGKRGQPVGLRVTYDATGRQVAKRDSSQMIALRIRNAVRGVGGDRRLMLVNLAFEQQLLALLEKHMEAGR